jgi:hypothetical protein
LNFIKKNFPFKTASDVKRQKNSKFFFEQLAFYGLHMELEPEPELFKSRNRNHSFSKVGTGTGKNSFTTLLLTLKQSGTSCGKVLKLVLRICIHIVPN